MRTLDLLLTLRDDLVASASPATEGGHESLDFIPGAMLLGAAAARLYGELPPADAYILFHSGTVRFGDGLPVGQDGAIGYPMPLCWHERKGTPASAGGRVVAERVRNFQHFQHGRFAGGEQPKQLREGHVGLDGQLANVKKTLRMKTAIDPESGRVAESQLFGYEAISAGQSFHARIEADPDLPEALWQRLTTVFSDGELLLGRSRSAEYGRVWVDLDAPPPAWPAAGEAHDGRLTLWCISELALMDERGQPTLEPTPERLGLGQGNVDWKASFLRFRSYAPWNAHRCAYDLERQVIRRGSVITLGLDAMPTADRLAGLTAGVGLWREAGLGQVWVNPPLLATVHPVFSGAAGSELPVTIPPRPDHPLIHWLEEQQGRGEARRKAEKRARELVEALGERYRLARTYAGLPDGAPIGPSPSQWGSVLANAKEAGDREELHRALFEGASAICKPKGEGWQDDFRDADGRTSFHGWFERNLPADLDAARAFARRAMDLARREHGRGDREEKSA
jgi:CRISPR-associated protein Csx10